jgi:DNA modification methylase
MQLFNGDCLEVMKSIPDKSVDMILTDPPYGTTACKWDSVIPFAPMWEQLNRIIKDNGPILLFGTEPFSSQLVCSNIKNYRHKWVWNKNNSCGFATVKLRPFSICEDILVFGKNRVNYYPIMESRGKPRNKDGYSKSDNYNLQPTLTKNKNNLYYPKNLLNFSNSVQKGKVHPTQKPVALLEYLIKTYTLKKETVLDFTMGSGSTGVACVNTNRDFIGIELDDKYFSIAKDRIEAAQKEVQNVIA